MTKSQGPIETRTAESLWAVGAFTVAYMLASIAGAVAAGNREFILYIGVMLFLIAAVVGVHTRVVFSSPLLWALSVWGALHMAGGLVPVPEGWPINGDIRVLYSLWFVPGRLKYDQVVHAYGFGVTTWACWQALQAHLAAREGIDRREIAPALGPLVLCAAAGLGFGAANEVVEFIATLTVPETNVGGYENTGWDLVANSVGAITAATLIGLFGRPKRG